MNRIPENIERLLSLKVYREVGIFALIALLAPLFAGLWVLGEIDLKDSNYQSKQSFTIDPYFVKTDHELFHDFLNGIKRDYGVLVLGTSESGSLHGKNYFHFLNSDPAVKQQFSLLGGAGRFAEVYIPLIAASPDAWHGLEVLLYVNPTYWRENLNKFREDYFTRYLDPRIAAAEKAELQELGIWQPLYGEYFLRQPPLKVATMKLDLAVEEVRSLFFSDLRQRFQKEDDPFSHFPKPLDHRLFSQNELVSELNLEWNVSEAFFKKGKDLKLPEVYADSDYRFRAVSGMISACKKHEVKLRIAIGSYNALLGTKGENAALIPAYEQVLSELRTLCEAENIPYIDLSDLSHTPGTYIDYQHHSSYGAMLKYERIKTHYENP